MQARSSIQALTGIGLTTTLGSVIMAATPQSNTGFKTFPNLGAGTIALGLIAASCFFAVGLIIASQVHGKNAGEDK